MPAQTTTFTSQANQGAHKLVNGSRTQLSLFGPAHRSCLTSNINVDRLSAMVEHTLVSLAQIVEIQDESLTEDTDLTGPSSQSVDYKIGARRHQKGHVRHPSLHDFAFVKEDSRLMELDQPATPARILFQNLDDVGGESCQLGKTVMSSNAVPSLSPIEGSTAIVVGYVTKPSATTSLAQEVPATPEGSVAVPRNRGSGVCSRERWRFLSSRPSMSLLVPYVPAASSPSARRVSADHSPRPGKTASKVGRLSVLRKRFLAFGRWRIGTDRLKFKKERSTCVGSSAAATKRVLSDYLRRSKATSC
ncbi:hypothetical protein E2C01_054033 [Portunus trituberculatus]|uniref:Uncharacterized protein n=1 Tax=Portunus trituberculatus TaxID=210409 RepID=A0A5B7GSM7_PORTR|nr:hypothetical protein [Portunus trituberculatus]